MKVSNEYDDEMDRQANAAAAATQTRDRCLAELARLRTLNAELAAAVADWQHFAEETLSEFDLEKCKSEVLCPKCRPAGCINLKIRNTRAALVKTKEQT